jgi:hypothetical protein
MHLAISLPALKPALDRPAEFRRIKDLYALRSEIAHGYAFKRSADIADATSQVAEIYRRLLRLSLARETSDALRQSLVDHVLEGTLLPVDSKAAVGGGDPDVEAYSELSERDVSEADAVLNGASATE